MDKIYKYFFYIVFILFFSFIIFLSFDSKFRATTLRYLINSYKIYMVVSVQNELKNRKKPDINLAVKKITNFINVSNKLANGKSSLLIGIYDTINLVETSIINEDDYGKFEEVSKKIVKLDPTLFKGRLLLAKSLIANGKSNEAAEELKRALELNPLDDDAYRILIKLAYKKNDKKTIQFLCNNYLNSNLGGIEERYKYTAFTGSNLNKFGVQLNPNPIKKNKVNEIYSFSGLDINKMSNYEIIPTRSINLSNLNLIFNFVPGTALEIKNILLFSGIDQYSIDAKEIFMTSRNSFFLNLVNSNIIFFTSYDNELINLEFEKNFKNIDKILIEMKFFKASLINKYCK